MAISWESNKDCAPGGAQPFSVRSSVYVWLASICMTPTVPGPQWLAITLPQPYTYISRNRPVARATFSAASTTPGSQRECTMNSSRRIDAVDIAQYVPCILLDHPCGTAPVPVLGPHEAVAQHDLGL